MEMMCIKNLGYKLKFIFSNPIKLVGKIIVRATSILGSVVTIFGIIDTIFKTDKYMTQLATEKLWTVIIISIVVSFITSINWIPRISFKINGIDSRLTIAVGNIINTKTSIIISTNTAFITLRDNNIISGTSVQGAFEDKYYKNNIVKLDNEIRESVKKYPVKAKLRLSYNNKCYNVYDIGTVAHVIQNDRNVYFLALNDINSHGQNENRNSNDFYTALDKIWLYIRQCGNTEKVSIPLIGSGHAGISEITKECALKEIVKSYIGQVQNYKILDELIIYIHPSDLEHVNISKIKKFVENECMFAEKNIRNGIKEE